MTDLTKLPNAVQQTVSLDDAEAMLEWGDYSPIEDNLEAAIALITDGKILTSYLILKITKE